MKNNEEYKYLTMGTTLGLCFGACVGIILCIFSGKSFLFGMSIGASLGMLWGIVIGAVLDYKAKNKKQ